MADLSNLLEELEENNENNIIENNDQQDWEEAEEVDLQLRKPTIEDTAEDWTKESLEKDASTAQKEAIAALSYTKLKNLWTAEANCPELLPYDETVIAAIREQITEAEERIEEMTSDGPEENPLLNSLYVSILTVDLERTKFLLSDLLRRRLDKIEMFPLHMREHVDRMSNAEMEYLKHYGGMLEKHLNRTVLDHFSQDAWKRLDEPEMIEEPDLSAFCFCRTAVDGVVLENDTREKGASFCLPYEQVRDLFLKGKIEMLV